MFIKEVIDRADALCENEFGIEEKYHWCDVLNADIHKKSTPRCKRAALKKWADGRYLLPEDCDIKFIKKIIIGRQSVMCSNMIAHGWKIDRLGSGRMCLLAPGFMFDRLKRDLLYLVYMPVYHPIRRINLVGASVEIPEKDENGKRVTLKMDAACPFIPGDTVTVTIGKNTSTLHIVERKAELEELVDLSKTAPDMFYTLEYGAGEADVFPTGHLSADMVREVTDSTDCGAPYDEMYVYYLCAQICFYQRDMDMYREFMEKFKKIYNDFVFMAKAFGEPDTDTVFTGWWLL